MFTGMLELSAFSSTTTPTKKTLNTEHELREFLEKLSHELTITPLAILKDRANSPSHQQVNQSSQLRPVYTLPALNPLLESIQAEDDNQKVLRYAISKTLCLKLGREGNPTKFNTIPRHCDVDPNPLIAGNLFFEHSLGGAPNVMKITNKSGDFEPHPSRLLISLALLTVLKQHNQISLAENLQMTYNMDKTIINIPTTLLDINIFPTQIQQLFNSLEEIISINQPHYLANSTADQSPIQTATNAGLNSQAFFSGNHLDSTTPSTAGRAEEPLETALNLDSIEDSLSKNGSVARISGLAGITAPNTPSKTRKSTSSSTLSLPQSHKKRALTMSLLFNSEQENQKNSINTTPSSSADDGDPISDSPKKRIKRN
ncbi:MAG: hypothetical protein KIT27_02470 [Legionellales bacterium]|nr:hypothetical protein [Legionellales bacterium]